MKLIKPYYIIYDEPTTCPHCGKKDAIEIFTDFKKPLGYVNRVKFMDPLELQNFIYNFPYLLRFCKCKYCLYEFELDWRYGLPRPLPF